MDLDKTNCYATNIQSRVAKGVATLTTMDQHEHQLKALGESVNPTKLTLLPPQVVEGKSNSSE